MIAGGEGARSWQERSRLRGPVGPSAASPIVSRGPATCPSLASRGGTQPPWPCPGSCFLRRAPSPSGDGWDRGHPCRPGPVLLGSPVCPSSRPRGEGHRHPVSPRPGRSPLCFRPLVYTVGSAGRCHRGVLQGASDGAGRVSRGGRRRLCASRTRRCAHALPLAPAGPDTHESGVVSCTSQILLIS